MNTPNIEPLESRIAPATLSISAPAAANEGSAGGGTTALNFTITLDAAASETVTVLASVVDGSATGADGDFAPQANVSVEFLVGQTSRMFTVNVNKDAKFETNENFKVVLSSPSGSHALHATAFEAVGAITNDDAAPTIGFDPVVVKVNEGNAGTTPLSFTVKLSNPSHQDVEFDWATEFSMAANAADGADFLGVGTTHVIIPAGSTEAVLVVSVNGDGDNEVEEVFFANLTNVMMGGAALVATNAQATGRIGNEEVLVSLTGTPTVVEGNSGTVDAVFTVSIPAAQAFDVTVEFEVVGSGANLAAVPADVQVPASVVIPAGQTSVAVHVPVVGDTLFELSETFELRVKNVINGAVDPGFTSATGTITDNDVASTPVVSVVQLDSVKNEGTGGLAPVTTFTFRVQLDRASGADVTVNVSTVDGTATGADGDFVSQLSVPVTIAAGQTQAVFSMVVNHDNKFESDETFGVQLSGPVNATLGAGFAQGTIRNDDAVPTLNINDVSVAEGNAGETDYTFTVTLSNPADRAVTFTWAAVPGTATEGVDYTAVAATLASIPAGQTTVSLTVKVAGDVTGESDETFFVNLSGAVAGALPLTITDSQGLGTIKNDELSVELGPDVTVNEADGTANFSLVLSGALPSSSDVEVTYRLVSGTATAGSDFTVPATAKVTIPAGSSSAVIGIPIVNDNLYEGGSEQFSIEILSVKNATLGARALAAGTITENDAVPEIRISDQTITEGNNGTKTMTFTVSLDRAASEAVTFDWETAVGLGTATAGVDYTAVAAGGKLPASVTIAPGAVSKTITVTVAGDLIFEKNETFFVNLLSPLLGAVPIGFQGGDSQAQGTITNDEAVPLIVVGDATLAENDASGMLVFNVSIASPADQDITFDWGTVLGTGTAGVDYTAVSAAVGTILAGQTTSLLTVAVAVNGDADDELDETLFVNLANAKLADGTPLAFQSNDSQGRGTIQNDDRTVSITQPTISAPESGSATVTLSLDVVSAHDVLVELTFAPGTALAGQDYTTPVVVTKTIPAGQLTVDAVVPFVNDTTREGDESFSVSITKVTNAVKGAGDSATITIVDNDAVPTIAIEDASVEEGDNGTRLLTFTVRLSNAVTQDVSFDWTTMDGTAESMGLAADLVANSANDVIIPAGQTTKTVSVVINGDTVDEGDETLFVNISDAKLGGAVDPLFVIAPGGDQAVGTIENDDVTVRISNASVTEGNAGTQLMSFTVSLDKLTTRPVGVTLSLEDVSAVLGKDYNLPGAMLVTIPAGSQSAVFSVPVLGDLLDEVNETFTAQITNATNAKIGNATATATILDDDATPVLSIGDVTLVEGNAGTREMVFTVTLSEASGQTVSVNAATINGTAISAAVSGNPADFVAKTESLVFLPERPDPDNVGQLLPAETSKEVRVTIHGDALHELDENFSVQLSNGVGALISPTAGTADATIQNDDAQPTLSITNVALVEGTGAGTTTFTFTVALSALSGLPVTVTAATLDGTALAGSDYTAKTDVLSIAAGQLSTTFNVAVTNDAFFELAEAFTVNLSGAVNAGISNGTGTGTILNDEVLPTLSIGGVTAVEGDTATKEVEFLVTLSSVQSSDVTFDWQTAGGTADGSDFVPVGATTVTIPAGQTSAKLKVTVNGDAADELDEEFFVNLSNGALLGNALGFTKAQGAGEILNDDLTVGVAGDIQVNEGDSGEADATFTIQLSAPSAHEVTVTYATQAGTATATGAAADFQAISGTVTFAPGEMEKTVTVKVNGDVNFDTANAFNLVLSQPVNAKLGVTSGKATIIEEPTDARPKVSVAGVTRVEDVGGGATTTFQFTVTLDHASDETVVVTAQTVADTALAGQDFTAKTQGLTFAPGETTKTFDVVVLNDSVFEAQEQFRVVLSDPINASIAAGEAFGVIEPDGDLAPRLKVTPQSVIEGNSGTRVMSFVVQKIGQTEAPVTFDFRTLVDAGDTAISDVDFAALDQQFTILPGESSVTVSVLVNGDTDDEATETFSVELANITGGRIDPVADGKAKGTIFNDDLTVSFSQADFSVLEGDSGQSDLVYVVSLSAVSAHDVTVTYTIAANTATEGADYQVPALLTLTIPAGQASGEIRVPALGDAVGENDETLSVTLTSVTNAQLGATLTTATGTILNDDAAIRISDGRAVEGPNGTTNMVFIVSLANASVFPVTVNYTTDDSGGATAGTDYGVNGEVSGTLTFASGETEKQIIVPIKGDTIVEGDETFTVRLSDPMANGAAIDALIDGEATGTIQDDEVFVSINDVTVIEGDSGTKQAIFTISLTPSSAFAVSVIATTMDDTAVSAGGSPDFVAKTQTITFNPGQTTQTFSVTINGDLAFEPASELFKVLLSGAAGALIVDGEGAGTINQSGDPAPTVSIGDATIIEGDAGTKVLEFVVSLSQPVDADVLVDIATAFGAGAGAADGADLVPVSTAGFVIPAGQRTAVFSVTVNGDATDEADETFSVNLTNARTTLPGDAAPTVLTLSDAQAVGKILNDDLTVSIAPVVSDTEGNTGTKAFSIPVNLSAVSNHDVTVTYNVSAGTAGGSDFTAGQNLTITIPAGQAGGTISVNVTGDALDENNETFVVTLVGVTGAQLGADTISTVTILDDDAAPTVTISSPTVAEGSSGTFTVTLSTVSERDVTIKWVTENGTAIGGDGSLISTTQGDFKQFTLTQTLVIPAGQTVGQIQVATVNDVDDETDEAFGVRILDSSENVTVTAGGIVGTATISANDLSALTIGDATVVEGNNGTVTLEFLVTRAGSGTKLPVTVGYSTSDGTAKASAGDYVAANSTITIPAGQSSAVISITVNGDALSEVNETLFVTLKNPVNATISDGSATGTIRNDEVSYKLVPVAGQSLTVDEEGAGGAEQIVEFKVVREGALDLAGTVFFSTVVDDTAGANTATSGTDFFALNGSVSFLVGASEASQTVKLRIKPDQVPEGAETLKVKLNNPINGVLAATDFEQVVTITDNDADKLPKVIISDAKVVEGNGAGTTNMVFTVTLVGDDGVTPKATGGSVVVNYTTANGMALAGGDYTAAPANASITIAAGQTTGTITIPVTRDSIDEADETFLVNLTSAELAVAGVASPLALTLTDAAGEGTILNDDLALALDAVLPAAEGSADNTRTFTFRIPQASAHDVTVKYVTKDGTAVSTGSFADFGAASGMVTILAGQTEATFTVLVHGDLYSESNEAFSLEFSDVTGAVLSSTSATVTLSNDDAAPSLTIGDATIVEGDAGTQQLVFTVTLAGGTQEAVTVDFSTTDGNARSDGPIVDYLSKTGTLTFPASATGGAQQISVTINGDTWRELNETFAVDLSGAKLVTSGTAVTIANPKATGTIQDDGDSALGLFVSGTRVVEGDAIGGTLTFVIETTAPVTGSAVTFVANTRPGTAQTADYTEIVDQAVSIPVGQSTASVAVRAKADTQFEPAEFMFLDLSEFSSGVSPLGASGGTVSAQGIILDDDVQIINGRNFQYVDTEGDIVTVKLSKGTLSIPTGSSLSTGDITFVKGGTVGGRFLQLLNLSNDGSEFAGTNISVTSRLQVLPDGTVLGDGTANVGAIESAIPVPGLFQFTTGVQLGKITVSGDLGRVIAGNSQRPAGIKSLNVGSFGDGTNLPQSNVGLPVDTSVVLGPIGKLTVNGDFAGSLLVIGDAVNAPIPTGPVGKIGKLVVKGDLKGGSDFGTGRILTTGGINSATLGGILGGGGDVSGAIQSVGGFATSIGKLKILGDIVGGAGEGSASIDVARIGKITIGQIATKTAPAIEADIIGGSGESSARIASSGGISGLKMNGSIMGGGGESSGQVFARTTLGKTKITGSIEGGSGSTSGTVIAGVLTGAVTLEGDLKGGSGADGGVLATNGVVSGFTAQAGNAPSITIGKSGVTGMGSIIGGTGSGSGRIAIDGSLGKFTVHGNIQGGSANTTGGIAVDGRIGDGTIHGSLIGGSAKPAADGGPVTLLRSGFIVGAGISSIVIDGQIKTGESLGADLPTATRTSLGGSALIASSEQIGSIIVRGTGETVAVLGNSTAAAIISARTSIGKASFGGDVEFAEILAGYSPVSSASAPRGTLVNLDAIIGKVIVEGTLRSSSVVAGINAGGDGLFGTIDDQSRLDGTTQPPQTKAVATITSVIANAVEAHADTPDDASYGIVAEQVKAVSVGGTAVSLNKGPHNDDATEVGGSASKLKVLEI